MYLVQMLEKPTSTLWKAIHTPYGRGQKLRDGKINMYLNEVDRFEFSIGSENSLYGIIKPFKTIVKVDNIVDGETEFEGRVLTFGGIMEDSGRFYQTVICENALAYLRDSEQVYAKVPNTGVADFFKRIITRHNSQVEDYKKFTVGNVTVTSDSNVPNRYIGYLNTFETLKDLINKVGGYIRLRIKNGVKYIDFLKEVGKDSKTAIEIGRNLKSSKRDLDFSQIVTRLIPLGNDLDTGTKENEPEATRPRLDISSVNGGIPYLEDASLISEFGIIEKSVTWTDIKDASILLSRGRQYMASQKAIIASWEVNAVEKSLIDPRFEKFKVGNRHPIINPPLSGIETLQIVGKTIDINNPQAVSLVVGADKKTLSGYQLQMQEATKSMAAVTQTSTDTLNTNIQNQLTEQDKAYQEKMADLQKQIDALKTPPPTEPTP